MSVPYFRVSLALCATKVYLYQPEKRQQIIDDLRLF